MKRGDSWCPVKEFISSWGLFRYWWVLVKLCLSLTMSVLVFFSLVPAVNELAMLGVTAVSADSVRASLGDIPTQLIFPLWFRF